MGSAHAPIRASSVRALARFALLVGAPALLILVLSWPMLFTSQGYNEDWIHHLWFMWSQSAAIDANHHPTFFLNDPRSVFYPEFAFYGGTLYSLVGLLALLLGNAPLHAYILSWLLGFAAAYGGWYWLGRMAGLGRGWAQLPALTFITAAYYITLIYARGDLPEFIGVSSIPLLIASGLSVLRAERVGLASAFALAGSAIVFFGSHNITMLWGSTLLLVVAVAVIVCVPQTRAWLTWRGVRRVALFVVPALLVNAWFLLPAIVYGSHTLIGHFNWERTMRELMYSVSAGHIFTLSRAPAIGNGGDFALSLPILAAAWAALAACVCWGGRRSLSAPWMRLLLLCSILLVLLVVMMTHVGLILSLPRQYVLLQYTYRLESYIVLLVSAAVLAALAITRTSSARRGLWRWVLVPITIVAVVGAIQQASSYPPGVDRKQLNLVGTEPPSLTERLYDYADSELPSYSARGRSPAAIAFPADEIHDEHITKVVHMTPHQLVYTNIGGGPELVHVTGAKIVGLSPEGLDVLEIDPSARPSSDGSTPTEVISLSSADSLPVGIGRVLSLLGILSLVSVFALLVLRSRRNARAVRRRSGEASVG